MTDIRHHYNTVKNPGVIRSRKRPKLKTPAPKRKRHQFEESDDQYLCTQTEVVWGDAKTHKKIKPVPNHKRPPQHRGKKLTDLEGICLFFNSRRHLYGDPPKSDSPERRLMKTSIFPATKKKYVSPPRAWKKCKTQLLMEELERLHPRKSAIERSESAPLANKTAPSSVHHRRAISESSIDQLSGGSKNDGCQLSATSSPPTRARDNPRSRSRSRSQSRSQSRSRSRSRSRSKPRSRSRCNSPPWLPKRSEDPYAGVNNESEEETTDESDSDTYDGSSVPGSQPQYPETNQIPNQGYSAGLTKPRVSPRKLGGANTTMPSGNKTMSARGSRHNPHDFSRRNVRSSHQKIVKRSQATKALPAAPRMKQKLQLTAISSSQMSQKKKFLTFRGAKKINYGAR